MENITAVFKEKKLKLTPQRLAVYKYLMSTKEHPSAEAIYKAIQTEYPTMSLATVYKTLDAFVQNGLVQQLNLGEDSYRYDADTSPHSHMQCTVCKSVEDIEQLQQVAPIKQEVQELTGYQLLSEQFYFYGICPECQKTAQ